jgi:AraC-like DNA-binding protein/mannose-6-phosphate isomerase-like protein (cupin superfamily)
LPGHPGDLTETPKGRVGQDGAMDVLSELLKVVKLDSGIFFHCEFSSPWCYRAPDSECAARLLAQSGRHVIVFHLLMRGRAYVHVEGGERTLLTDGDIVALPHGHAHLFGNGEGARPIDGATALPKILGRGLELVKMGGGGEPSLFVCGFLSCDPILAKTLLQALPPLVRVNIRTDPSGQWLENSLRFAVAEAVAAREGASAMLAKLSEVVFMETVRRHVRARPETETGWLAGARDPAVGRVLYLFHQRPAHPWTMPELAKELGVSRSVLAERFRHYVGQPVMAYLTSWRLQLGARSLTSSDRSVAEIASEVGYKTEAAFNRAFKRQFRLPPARYRNRAAGRAQAGHARTSTARPS